MSGGLLHRLCSSRKSCIEEEEHGPVNRILIDNSSLLVFEVKSAACKVEEVDRFADKVELVRRQHPDKAVEGALISLEPADTVKARCAEWGIQIL